MSNGVYGEVIPKSSQGESLVVAAVATKQYSVQYVSIKGTAAGTGTLTIGSTVVWRGVFDANGADGQFFGELGIKNGNALNEAITLAVTDGGTYRCNFGYREISRPLA